MNRAALTAAPDEPERKLIDVMYPPDPDVDAALAELLKDDDDESSDHAPVASPEPPGATDPD